MANRLYHPSIPRRPKERPFNDEDTRIQIREDYVQRYTREPLWRKAKEERVINWSLTSPMLLDMETHNEDDDVGVRTRERHLPQTPTQLEFLAGVKDAQAPLQTRDLEMTLRYINDSIRWDAEFTKIFILGILRQLRYWVQGHNPEKLQQQGMSALLYVRDDFLPKLETGYQSFLNWVLYKKRPIWIIFGTFFTLILSFVLTGVFPPKVLFFPENQPNYINVFVELPVGTNISKTNQATKEIKNEITMVLSQPISEKDTLTYLQAADVELVNNTTIRTPFVESIIEQVGKGTSDPNSGPSFGETPHKARITISFCEFSHRKGLNTSTVKSLVEKSLKDKFHADITIVVDKEQSGPPQQPPVNIEVTGSQDYGELTQKAEILQQYLIKQNIDGLQKLKLDVEVNKAEIQIDINREYAKRVGISTGQIAQSIRTSLFGKDVSTYNYNDEDYDINIRFSEEDRQDVSSILEQKVMFMNNRGVKLSIPISSVVNKIKEVNKYAAVIRKNQNNTVTVFSGVQEGYNANEIIAVVKKHLADFNKSEEGASFTKAGFNYKFTGQMEDQEKELAFLSSALLFAVFLILLILVSQFNAFSSPLIILSSVVLSLAGVFLGIVISRNDFVIIMTMIGIISLAGIVVNNAIVLVDYTNLIRRRKRTELGLGKLQLISNEDFKNAVIEGGKTRLRPVLLTAITTILGLFPLASGLNINFFTLVSDWDPQIFFGGDNVIFFKPMSLAIIYGLTFATFLTLVVVPIMYYTIYRFKLWLFKKFNWTIKIEL